MPSPQAAGDIRLRRLLDDSLKQPVWPTGYAVRTLQPSDAAAVHALLVSVFDDGQEGPFPDWWQRVSQDGEFDPTLCFLAVDSQSLLVGVALCWTSGFVKDLAVDPQHRGKGIGDALMAEVFRAFKARKTRHVDLKTSTVLNADAVRLYRRLGMVDVPWSGDTT